MREAGWPATMRSSTSLDVDPETMKQVVAALEGGAV